MIKRLFAAASVAGIAVVGMAPTASASSASWEHKPQTKVVKIIDWDAPTPAPGEFTTQRIDWD